MNNNASKPENTNIAPMLNAYPDSIGSRLSDMTEILKKDALHGAFGSFYILPSL